MKFNKIILVALLAILLSGFASAEFIVNKYTNEFAVTSPVQDVKACACGVGQDTIDVTNHGNIGAIFQVDIETPYPDWMEVAESNFWIEPGQSKAVHISTRIPCDYEGAFTYRVKVHTSQGRDKFVDRQVLAKDCQNIRADLSVYESSVYPCTQTEFDINVENTGKHKETYYVGMDESFLHDSHITFSEDNIALQPGETGVVHAVFSPPCSLYGVIDMPFMASTELTGQSVLMDFDLTIIRDYDFTMSLPDLGMTLNNGGMEVADDGTLKVCSKVVTEVPVDVKNIARIANTYTFDLVGPSYAGTDLTELSVNPGQTRQGSLIFNPSGLVEGSSSLSLKAESALGDMHKELKVDYTVENCYDHELDIETNYADVCCGQHEYAVKVVNTGSVTDTFHVDAQSDLEVGVSPKFVVLSPGEEALVTLSVDALCTDELYEIKVFTTSEKSGLIGKASLVLNSLSPQSCYDVLLDPVEVRVLKENMLKGVEVPVKFVHNGLKGGDYRVYMDSQVWDSSTLDEVFNIGPGMTKSLDLMPENADAVAELNYGRYLSRIVFMIEDPDYGPIVYEKSLFTDIVDRSLASKVRLMFSKHPNCIFGLIIFVLATIAAILVVFRDKFDNFSFAKGMVVFKRRKWEGIELFSRWMLMLGVFALAFILLSWNGFPSFQPKNVELADGPLLIQWFEDNQHVMDLNDYFEDPDLDSLSYTSTFVENINVSISGSKVTFTPDYNWHGTRQVIFTADDGKGGVTDSSVLTLEVLDVKEKTLGNIFGLYCCYIFLGLLLLIWIVVMIDISLSQKVVIVRK
ncbi:hypothetical protein JW868_02440 [Candidatus Woesearchaeota archaeon]|nr:hypothetical protein [Candidatus Woesearchaeota archaeon]